MRVVLAIFVLAFVAIAVARPSFRAKNARRAPLNLANLRSFHGQLASKRKQYPTYSEGDNRELKALLENLLEDARNLRGPGGGSHGSKSESMDGSSESGEDECEADETCKFIEDDGEFFECTSKEEEKLEQYFEGVYKESTGDDLITKELSEMFDQASQIEDGFVGFLLKQNAIEEAVRRFEEGMENVDLTEELQANIDKNACKYFQHQEDAFWRMIDIEIAKRKK